MKNLIVLAEFPPNIGGTTIWYYRCCELLLKKGYRIFTLGGRGCPPKGAFNLNPVRNENKYIKFFLLAKDVLIELIVQCKVLIGLIFKRLLCPNDFIQIVSFLVMIRRTRSVIPKENGIVLVSHVNMNSLLAYLLCKRHKSLKLVIREHGGGILEFAAKRPQLVRFLLSQADYVNCVSEYIAEKCKKLGASPDKIKVIFSARDIPEIDTKLRKENIVLFCGFLEPRKDPITYLRSIKELASQNGFIKEVKFMVIGDGSLKSQMTKYCIENGLEKFVTFTGSLPLEQVWHWMKKSKVLVLPSIREPSGAVLTEAMAYRCYCIATNVGGIPEIVSEQRGSLFEPGNYGRLAKLIFKFFNTEANYVSKISLAYQYVKENYSFEKAAEQLNGIFEKVQFQLRK